VRILAITWLVAGSISSAPLHAQPPQSPRLPRTETELAAARKLFADALRDEEGRRFDVALEKFRRVLEVRDTAAIEYHVGTCLEGLGHFADALSAFGAAATLGDGDRAASDVTDAARERISELSKRVGHLTLLLSSRAPQGAEAEVDRRPVSAPGDVVLDPGTHSIEATAPGVAPFQSDITLPEGGRASLTLSLDPPPPPSPPLPATRAERTSVADRGANLSTWGTVSIGAGSALLAGSVISFVLRENDISKANQDCPGGGCPTAFYGVAKSAASRARVEGPLGWTLAAGGLAAVGVGVYLVWTATIQAASLTLAPAAWRDGAGIELRGTL
jgi:hypothetical protein